MKSDTDKRAALAVPASPPDKLKAVPAKLHVSKTKLLSPDKEAQPNEGGAMCTSSTQALMDLAAVALWITLSAFVIMFNKFILSYKEFPFPITLTMWHMLFSSSIAIALVKSNAVSGADITLDTYKKAVVPIGALFAGTLWLGNAAYVYLSVSFIQMLKALMPAAVLVVGCAFGTETFKWTTTGTIAIISTGVALASAGEINFVVVGVLFQLASIATESTRLTLVQILLQRRGLKLNPITTLYYVAPASFVFLCVPWYYFESATLLPGEVAWPSPTLLLSNAVAAFALNLSVFVLIGRTSALTMNVAGVIKDWLLIGLSAFIYGSSVTGLNLVGYSIAFGGVCCYNRAKMARTAAVESSK